MATKKDIPELELENFKILFTPEDIQRRVRDLGEKITEDYSGSRKRKLITLGILNGAFIFHSDLIRNIHLDPRRVYADFMRISSYKKGEISSGEPQILSDTKNSIRGADVIIVEDIVDTGYSLEALMKILEARGANSIEICAFLSKKERRIVESIDIKYVGFEIPDKYVVGYGMDNGKEEYRSFDFIGYLED
jgi:hypoxanthine phosphoribosyltransferase